MKNLSKKNKIIIICVSVAVVLALVLGLSLGLTVGTMEKINLDFSIQQIEEQQLLKVEWKTSIFVDSVQITVKNSDKTTVCNTTLSNPTEVAKGETYLTVPYGKHTVSLTVRKGKYSKAELSKQAKLSCDEYVIAPLVATMPVTFFSLNIKEYSDNYSIPTFVWLQRGGAWNYANLHENVYLIPYGNYGEMSTYTDPVDMYEKTAKWVKELYEINPDSKFHFYYNDFHPWGWMQATVANKIPTENYDVTLLSDGTGSLVAFNEMLGGSNSDTVFERMCEDYDKLKTQIANKGAYSHKDKKLAISTSKLRHYVFCMLTKEPNVKLVLARDFVSRDLAEDNPVRAQFLPLVSNTDNPDAPIKILSMYSLLTAMNSEEQAELKNLYKFSDNMFEKAVQENKKIMVLMGTNTSIENDSHFDDYVKATKAYYGSGYVYYYKGHPATPTMTDSSKQKKLESLGLIDIDSTISAELIFFFNQDAYATGFGSSTYNSLDDKQVCGVWNTRLKDVFSEYKEKVDFTISKLSSGDPEYGSLASDSSYLFEFADTTNYNIAVYNARNNTIKYYKQNGNAFNEVSPVHA